MNFLADDKKSAVEIDRVSVDSLAFWIEARVTSWVKKSSPSLLIKCLTGPSYLKAYRRGVQPGWAAWLIYGNAWEPRTLYVLKNFISFLF